MPLYLPGTQDIQLLYTPVQPALHKQELMSPPGGSVCEFAGHERHRDLSLSECKPGAHGWHVSAVDALTASENFPGSQSVHAIDPGFVLYLPATQAIQLPFTPDQAALQT